MWEILTDLNLEGAGRILCVCGILTDLNLEGAGRILCVGDTNRS